MVHLKLFLRKKNFRLDRQRAKLEMNLGSISEMTRLPGAIFVVDTMNELNLSSRSKKIKYSNICNG